MTSAPEEENDLGDPVAWLESVTLEGSDEPVRVVLDGRDGHRVFLRRLDPTDGDNPPRVPVYVGDVPVMTEAISHLGHQWPSRPVRDDRVW